MSRDNIVDGLILNIVQTQEIAEQSDLQSSLHQRGYNIPQATLSRRLKKLKIAKVSGLYKAVDFNSPNLPLILNIEIAENGLIVLHTHPGSASSLAYFIDRKFVKFNPASPKDSGILGTIAGDDTVLVIVKSRDLIPHVNSLLQREFPYLINTIPVETP